MIYFLYKLTKAVSLGKLTVELKNLNVQIGNYITALNNVLIGVFYFGLSYFGSRSGEKATRLPRRLKADTKLRTWRDNVM